MADVQHSSMHPLSAKVRTKQRSQNYASSFSSERNKGLIFASGSFASFVLTTWALSAVCGPLDWKASDEWYNQVPDSVYLLPAAAFCTAFLHNFFSLLFETKRAKVQLAVLMCYVNFVACVFELLCLARWVPIWRTAEGRPIMMLRYCGMWAHTTPQMLWVMSLPSDLKQSDVLSAVAVDWVMVVIAPLGDLTTGASRYLCWGLSFLCFPYVALQIWRMYESTMAASSHPGTRATLGAMRAATLFFWSCFPMAWCVVQTGMLTWRQEELLWSLADVCGKVLFSCSLVHSNLMPIEQRQVAAMRVVEEANRIKVIHELQELVEQKQQFIALMSHELRTPLNGIIGLSDALLGGGSGRLSKPAAKTVQAVRNSGSRLLGVINDILEAASCFKGELVVDCHKVQLGVLVDTVLELARPLLQPGVQLSNRLPSELPCVAGDSNRIVQVLHNLMSNAAKFTHEGEVWVSAAVADGGRSVAVEVGDTGIGIPADQLHAVFSTFRQADMSFQRSYGGSGLGLSVVRQLVEAHGGDMKVTSEEGRGSTFTFTLPVWGATSGAPERCEASAADTSSSGGQGPRLRRSGEFERMYQSVRGRVAQKCIGPCREDFELQERPQCDFPRASSRSTSRSGSRAAPKASAHAGQAPPAANDGTQQSLSMPTSRKADKPSSDTGVAASVGQRSGWYSSCTGSGEVSCPDAPAGMTTTDEKAAAGVDSHGGAGEGAGTATASAAATLAGQQGSDALAGGSQPIASGSDPIAGGDATDEAAAPARRPETAAASVQSHVSGDAATPHDISASDAGSDAAAAVPAPLPAPAAATGSSQPPRVPENAPAAPASCSGRQAGGSAGSTIKVLSVDDDPVNQLVIRKFLQRGGYDVKQALDGPSALDMMFGSGYVPDLILLDIMMPGMDGFEVCRRVRRQYPDSQLPVIMVSARGRHEAEEASLQAGSNDYITKPVSCTDLLERIAVTLQRCRSAQGAYSVPTISQNAVC